MNTMDTRSVISMLALVAVLAPAGCNGPTKSGKLARAEARDRIAQFNAHFTFDQAEQDFKVGQFDRALRTIDAGIEQEPEVPDFFVLKGRIHLEQNDLEDAIHAFLSAVELDPNHAEGHYFAGIVYQRWSDDEEAFGHYRAAFQVDSDNVHYLIATAETLIAMGELVEAQEFVKSRLTYFEHNSALRHLLGQIALLNGDPATAARLYWEALLLDAENTPLLEELAWAQYDAGMFAECRESLEILDTRLEGEPRTDLLHLEARCLVVLNRGTEAQSLYLRLKSSDPSNPSVWIEFGTVAWKRGDYRWVAECSLRTIDLAPARFEGYLLKGLFEQHKGRSEDAIREFRKAVSRSQDTVITHLALGRALEEAGHSRDALTAYGKALEVDPQSPGARSLYSSLADRMHVAAAE